MSNTIELTRDLEVKKQSKILPRIPFKLLFLCTVFSLGAYYGPRGMSWVISEYLSLKSALFERLTRVEVIKEYINPSTEPIPLIIERVSKEYNIPPLLIRALHIQESGRGLRTDRIRYEPTLQKRFKRESWMTDAEYQALASSWGLGQIIYGIWKRECELESYADLLNPSRNIECSARILRGCLDKKKALMPKSERFRACLDQYNGDVSGGYSTSVLAHLTDIVLEEQDL